jgi:predicted dinucleotide-binding enzyme
MVHKEICIIGAGNGGSAIAGDMTLAGTARGCLSFLSMRRTLSPSLLKVEFASRESHGQVLRRSRWRP